MSRRARNLRPKSAAAEMYMPKPAPGDVFVREFVSARTGQQERLRNIGEHPLTLAHARGRISDDQFAAGEELRRLYALREARGRDSSQMRLGSGGAAHTGLSQVQLDAIRRLGRLRSRLKDRDWIILEKFCGDGWSMAESVRAATVCHPSGVIYRMLEALDELVVACGGRTSRVA